MLARCFLVGCLIPAALSASPDPDRFVPGRLLVKFRAGTPAGLGNQALARFGARSVREMHQIGVHIVQLPPSASETAYARLLERAEEVEFAEPDALVPPDVLPNDPYFSSQWHLTRIQAPEAWDVSTGAPGLMIAILDSGVDATHPDLAAKIVPGWNFYDNNGDTSDVYGHGTKVAGTAAAAADNAVGVASVAWNCRILPVRIARPDGYGSVSAMASGLIWAADQGARVANLSFAVSSGYSTITSAAQYFQSKGGVVTVSAGNSATAVTAGDNPYVVTVSGTDPNDLLYSWSNRGNNLDVAAPGCAGSTTIRGGGYGSACGTSFSAPTTAGVVALIMSVAPRLSATDAVRILRESADDLGAGGWDTLYGWGRINAGRAAQMALSGTPPPDDQPPEVSFTSPAEGATVSGMTAIQAVASDNVGVASVSIVVNGSTICTKAAAPYACNWDTTKVANGAYTLLANAVDQAGNYDAALRTVMVGNLTDETPPLVSITSPATGAVVSNKVAVTVTAADNVGVARAELYVDGVLVGRSTSAPFTMLWNSRKAKPGAHVITVKAIDAAGNWAISAPVLVTVR
jgi:subtilisin family serine protease